MRLIAAAAAYLKRYVPMGKIITIVAGAVLLGAVAYVGLVIHALSTIGETLKEVSITEGAIAGFAIGASKDELLSMRGVKFNANSKSHGCGTGWVEPASLIPAQRACFAEADRWGVTSSALFSVCPKHTDQNAELSFGQSRLVKVRVWCTRPE
jgi:hypothetical protein